jgi:hypothetical protein
MAITDIQISEELETNAPSIKYRGNEGPKSPQEIEMMMTSVDDPFFRSGDADDHALEMFGKPYKDLNADELEEFLEEMRRLMNKFSGGQPLPQDPTKPVNPFAPKPTGPVLPDRQMAAYGGIMGLDGRRQYGIGSSLKKFVRKVIPNEVAKVAEVAAPFVAPFNPLAAGLMKGIGGFDRTGSIGDSLKSGLMTYGGGQLARGIGGADLQKGFNFKINPNATGLGQYFSSPYVQGEDIFSKTKERFFPGGEKITILEDTSVLDEATKAGDYTKGGKKIIETSKSDNLKLLDNFKNAGLDTKAMLGILGLSGAAGLYTGMTQVDDVLEDVNRGSGMNNQIPSGILNIRKEVIEAMKDPSGKLLEALRVKYPFLGTQASKDVANMAMGGRIGFSNGGDYEDKFMELVAQLREMGFSQQEAIEEARKQLDNNMAYGGRINRAEGGLMDLGGMEKDYRAGGS